MNKAENTMRKEWTYGGRELWTTVQWTEEGSFFRIFAFVNLKPENDKDDVQRWSGYGYTDTPAALFTTVLRNAEIAARAYVDSLEPNDMIRTLVNSGYSNAESAQDKDDFWYYSEFDYITSGNPRP